MTEKYEKGTFLVYDTYGVCEVTEVRRMKFSKTAPLQTYYVLTPINSHNSTFYLPADNKELCARLRKPMSEKQIKDLLSAAEGNSFEWIDNRQIRNENFHRILDKGITPELIGLIICLYKRKLALDETGKRLSSTDEGFLSSAEKLVNEEFAFSLSIGREEVAEYIRSFFEA